MGKAAVEFSHSIGNGRGKAPGQGGVQHACSGSGIEGKSYFLVFCHIFLKKLRDKLRRRSPGMAIPLKAISIAFCGRGVIFEGLRQL